MSSTLDVYAIRVQTLKEVVGSHDQSLLAAIKKGQAALLASVDEIDDEADLKCSEALTHIINGAKYHDDVGYVYGYALKAICAHVGTTLPNIPGIAGAPEWIESMDEFLHEQKIPVQLETLVYGGSPIPIPAPDDFPFIGQWKNSVLPKALEAFDKLDLADAEDEIADTCLTIRKWLKTATMNAENSISGFLF